MNGIDLLFIICGLGLLFIIWEGGALYYEWLRDDQNQRRCRIRARYNFLDKQQEDIYRSNIGKEMKCLN